MLKTDATHYHALLGVPTKVVKSKGWFSKIWFRGEFISRSVSRPYRLSLGSGKESLFIKTEAFLPINLSVFTSVEH